MNEKIKNEKYMIRIKFLSIIGFVFILFSYIGCIEKTEKANSGKHEKVILTHAREFVIEKTNRSTKLRIRRKGKDAGFDTFYLVKDKSAIKKRKNTIEVPCKKIICLSSTQLSYFFALDDIDEIVAINSSRYLHHRGMKARVEAGKTRKIGKEGVFNIETIIALDPDLIFVSPFKAGGYDLLRNLGIPLVPMTAYNEKTPLGRAEWIKMIALFVGQEEKAGVIFNGIEKRYLQLKQLASKVKRHPTVFSGKLRSGSWYVPGGNSFYARYFRDAGAEYIIKDNIQGAYPLDFETIYCKAASCDFWQILHPEKTGFDLKGLAKQDPRYADFKAFKKKNVLLCNMREIPYHEQAGIKPDLLLADYISYFHPELLPDHTPYFYKRLK
jgi:iron complex transport system substrate-binding protein